MDYLVVCTAAVAVAALTLFSGFGLGSLLMPAFAVFFPIDVAVAATAVVHLANNVFKAILVGRGAVWPVVLRFGIPAAIAAIFGALLLEKTVTLEPLANWSLGGRTFDITGINLVIGGLIVLFAVRDVVPAGRKLSFGPKWLPFGGALAGFFGGLSGHQGALRSAFLINLGLGRDGYIGTSVAAAVIVDVVRLTIYGIGFVGARFSVLQEGGSQAAGLVVAATIAAFFGSFLGAKLVKKVTIRWIEVTVGIMLLVFGPLLALGMLGK